MIIKKLTNNQLINKPESKTEKDELPQEIKDIIDLGSKKTKEPSFLKMYKNHREEETDGKEPWWTEAADAFHIQGDVVEGLGGSGVVSMISTAGSGIGAVGLGIFGAMELKEGIKNKDFIKSLEGGSALLAGAASGADFVANTLEAHHILGSATHSIVSVAEPVARVFGIVHGSIDVALGSRELIRGIKEKNQDSIVNGSLEIGIGGTMIIGALGIGGPITAAALGTLFVSKVAYDHRKNIGNLGKKIVNKIKDKEEPALKS